MNNNSEDAPPAGASSSAAAHASEPLAADGTPTPPADDRYAPSDTRISRRQGLALGIAGALTLAGAAYSVSTLDSRQALADRSAPRAISAPSSTTSPATTSPSTISPSPTGSGSGSPSATPSTTPTEPGTGPRPVADGLLVPPAPWERLSDASAKTGRVTLARAAEIDGHGELSRIGLRQLGFSSGLSRAWQAGGSALLVLNYRFRDAKAAAGFVTYGRKARDADSGFRRIPVTGVPGAVGYRSSDARPATRVVLFSRGSAAFIVGVQDTPPPGAAGDVAVLAEQQYAAAAG